MNDEETAAPGLLLVVGASLLVLVLAVLTTAWGAFLVPLRLAGVAVPVGALVAVVGNLGLTTAAGRVAGRPGAVVVGGTWLVLAFVFLGSVRSEGDLVVPGTWPGYLYLFGGAAAAVAGVVRAPDRSWASPGSGTGR